MRLRRRWDSWDGDYLTVECPYNRMTCQGWHISANISCLWYEIQYSWFLLPSHTPRRAPSNTRRRMNIQRSVVACFTHISVLKPSGTVSREKQR